MFTLEVGVSKRKYFIDNEVVTGTESAVLTKKRGC